MSGTQTTCDQCRFFEQHDEDLGHCRRYAPRPRTDNEHAETVWPCVSAGDVCGEISRREEEQK